MLRLCLCSAFGLQLQSLAASATELATLSKMLRATAAICIYKRLESLMEQGLQHVCLVCLCYILNVELTELMLQMSISH